MTPAHTHINLHVLSRDGALSNSTVGAPGTHGAGVLGTQGIGVRAPIAAAVALATTGLAKLRHRPNGIIFTMGTWSMMLAAGWLLDRTRWDGRTINELGAIP